MNFEKIYNCIESFKENNSFYKNLGANNVKTERPVIYINDVIVCKSKSKRKVYKAADYDGLTSESIMYDTNKSFIYVIIYMKRAHIVAPSFREKRSNSIVGSNIKNLILYRKVIVN